MSTSVQAAGLSNIYYSYKNNSSLINSFSGKSDDTASSSFLNGITNLDSYVSSSLSTESTDATYSEELLKKNYNLTSLTNALDAITNTESFDSISNLNDYVTNLFKESQSSEYETLSDTSSELSSLISTNITQSIINSYKSNSVMSNLKSSAIDIIK